MSCKRLAPPLLSRGSCLVAVVIGLSFGACGRKGDPLPPIRIIPATTQDLSIHQQGNLLILRMTYPQATVAGQILPELEALEIWELVAPVTDPAQLPTVDAVLFQRQARPLLRIEGAELRGTVSGDQIEARLPLLDPDPAEPALHTFAIKTVASEGEPSSYSNLVSLIVQRTVAAPGSLVTQTLAEGVELRWSAVSDGVAGYNIYRRDSTIRAFGDPLAFVDQGNTRYLDTTAQFGSRYIYTLRAVGSKEPLVEGHAAAETEVFYSDVFAPAPPVELLALGEPGRARLVWEKSPASDVDVYRVYRQDIDGGEYRLVGTTTTLEHLDPGLASGRTYRYRVTAVDTAENEGPASETVSVLVQ